MTTYWQVGTVSTFNGTQWVPTPGVDAALSGSPTSTAAIAPTFCRSPRPSYYLQLLVAIAGRLHCSGPASRCSVTGLAQWRSTRKNAGCHDERSRTDYEVSARLDTAISNAGPPLGE